MVVALLSGLVLADPAAAGPLAVAADSQPSGRLAKTAAPEAVDRPAAPAAAQTVVTLPAGRLGRTYHRMLVATGGTPPHRFTLESGSLPAGLSLSSEGVLSGTATEAGDWSFTARVVDVDGQSMAQFYHLRIFASPAAPR